MTVYVVQRVDCSNQTKELIAIFNNREKAASYSENENAYCGADITKDFESMDVWFQVEEWIVL